MTTGKNGAADRLGAIHRWKLLLGVATLAVLLFGGGSAVRQHLGFDFSLDGLASIRDWVTSLGWLGIATFVGLVSFRTFLLLPSHMVLILGGLAFGAVGGAVWGTLGLLCSALLQFGAARLLGDDWVRPRLGQRGLAVEERVRRAGAGVVWIVTAHPAGPQTAVNFAAGLASMPIWQFVLAVVLAAPLRAGSYSLLGTSILSWGVPTFAAITAAFSVVLLAPLAIPSVRNWVLGTPAGGVG